jgi:hypothetical protein
LANRKPAQLPTAMLRQGRFKLVCHGVDDERPQLFDLVADPDEQQDLGIAPDAAAQRQIAAMRQALAQCWDPAAADRTAKLATRHMRRLYAFEKEHDSLVSSGWTGAFEEARHNWP